MYVPDAFRMDDEAMLMAFVEQYPFATLFSQSAGDFPASHLPLLIDREQRCLLGHVARNNTHWRVMNGKEPALAVFHGPHAYISPTYYASSPAVPTWNYATVHVHGRPRTIPEDQLALVLDRLLQRFENPRAAGSKYEAPAQFLESLMPAIVGFEMPIERWEGKFKLGQNRSLADQQSMLAHLEKGGSEEQALARFIKRQSEAVR